jgi:hypothetical protein
LRTPGVQGILGCAALVPRARRDMPPIVTSNAQIMCAHGGQVKVMPRQTVAQISGGMILCEGDLMGAPILGCPVPPSPGSKPCTTVVSTLPGSTSLKVNVQGRPVHVASLSGLTDGVPPAPIMVANPGQVKVQA